MKSMNCCNHLSTNMLEIVKKCNIALPKCMLTLQHRDWVYCIYCEVRCKSTGYKHLNTALHSGLGVSILQKPHWLGFKRLSNGLWGDMLPGRGLGGGSLGLLLGVWTLQILMNPAISMMRAIPISRTAHQWAWWHRMNTQTLNRNKHLINTLRQTE